MASPYGSNKGYPECWISRLLARKGQDYIDSGKLYDNEVLRNIDQIINDIINGRIDYSKYGNYVLNPVIFDNLLSYCRSKVSTKEVELYSLSYTNWACETGKIIVANTNRFPDGKSANPTDYIFPYNFDVSILNAGFSTITSATKNTISVALRDTSIEYNKYKVLRDILEHIQVTKNIYELQWATSSLKQFVRSNNNFIY